MHKFKVNEDVLDEALKGSKIVVSGKKKEDLSIELLEKIMTMAATHRFFIWLYLPISIIEIDDVIELQKVIKIPDYIFLRKLIVYCRYHDMDLDRTIDYLYEKGLIKKDIESLLIIQEAFETPARFNELNDQVIPKIVKLGMSYIGNLDNDIEVEHKHYPMVDPEKGRAELGWLKCYHFECDFKGHNAEELKTHLTTCKAYTAYFHKSHENVVAQFNLTEEVILERAITKCPSPICDVHNSDMTPEDLVVHFKRLGIRPFWKKGDVFDYAMEKFTKNEKEGNLLNFVNDTPIYFSDGKECCVCLHHPPSVLFVGCNHHIICTNCVDKIRDCPLCRTKVALPICY